MLKSYKAIIFDLDGTLLDTLEDLANSANRVLSEKGFPTHTVDSYRYFVGDGSAMLITRALPEDKRNDDMVQRCFDAFIKDYHRNWNVSTKPYDGIAEMLDTLAAHRIKLAVLSNKPHDFAKLCVTEMLNKWRFEAILGQRKNVPRKPDPAGALEAAQILNISPLDFLFLGDSAVDMKTALAAGMYPVGALWGFRSAKELLESGARTLIKEPLEILNLIAGE